MSNVKSKEALEKEAKDQDVALKWHLTALILGYNEISKRAKIFGQRVYFNLASQKHEADLVKLGGRIERIDGKPTITIGEHMPHINLTEDNIELMRTAVREWDEKKGT